MSSDALASEPCGILALAHWASSVGIDFLVHVAVPEVFSWSFNDWSLINSSSMASLSSGTMPHFRNAAIIIAGCIVFSCIDLKTAGNLPLETHASPLVTFCWFIVLLISDHIFLNAPTLHGCKMCVNFDWRHSKIMLFCMAASIRFGLTYLVAPMEEEAWPDPRPLPLV